MSISVLITTADTNAKTSFPVVGDSELNALWKPIIERRGLHYLDYLVTAGLTIDAENCGDVTVEIQTLLKELESSFQFEDDITNPVFRCKRLLEIVKSCSPQSKTSIYVG